jgi:murein DD-endopeptidase MepM/ murein hydrolase activator NlpD
MVKKKQYTLMIIPGSNSRVRKFIISEKILKGGVVLAGVFCMFLLFFLMDYARSRARLSELRDLRTEVKMQRTKMTQMAQGLIDLDHGMSRLRKFEAKLRTAFDLDRDYYSTDSLTGVGGGGQSLAEMLNSMDVRQKELVAQIDRDLEKLKSDVNDQEQGFSDLLVHLQDQQSLLSSTPSIVPARGWTTSGFKRRRDPFTGRQTWHRGLDISANVGSPVVAPADGVVTYSGKKVDFGNIITIDHGYGYKTRYGHNSKLLARRGQKVKRGQVIAFIGSTGRSTGPHLHYEVLRNGVPVNPSDYVLNN